jgi:hypothetical protein
MGMFAASGQLPAPKHIQSKLMHVQLAPDG